MAGLRIGFADGTAREFVLASTGRGWTDDPAMIEGLLDRAPGDPAGSRPPSHGSLRTGLRGLSVCVAAMLRTANSARLGIAPRSTTVRILQRRLLTLAGCAARLRHGNRLHYLEQGIRFLRRGLTAGEERRIEEWLTLSDAGLFERLLGLPPEPVIPAPSSVTLTGVLLVEPGIREG